MWPFRISPEFSSVPTARDKKDPLSEGLRRQEKDVLPKEGEKIGGEAAGRERTRFPETRAPNFPLPVAPKKGQSHLSLKGEALLFCLVSGVALVIGVVRHEVVLTLLGIGGLAGFFYGVVSLFWVSWGMPAELNALHWRILPEETDEAHPPQWVLTWTDEKKIKKVGFPGITKRYHLVLASRDGRSIEVYASLPREKEETRDLPFPTRPRGAYEIKKEELVIYDFLGFWELAFPKRKGESAPALLVRPLAREVAFSPPFVVGGIRRRESKTVQKTEDLTDHRPYVPGDDPRRINWKLYGHSRELFVRKEETEPPPQSEYVLLLDTYADPSLYSTEAMWSRTDRLVYAALGLGRELLEHRGSLLMGYSGGALQMVQKNELSYYLAFPYGQREGQDLPVPPPDKGVFLFALPRRSVEATALTALLTRCQSPVQLIFVCGSPAEETLARDCQQYYAPHQRMAHVSFLTF
ncbi:hypothetical protein C5O22_04365 [Treponema sp. J25]|nr:hypothetical protein C5O22_04365 [Treponema sp. J25]